MHNALKYTPEGGLIRFGIKQLPGSNNDECLVQFVCEDTGVGISEEFMPHIYELFEREDNEINQKIESYHSKISELLKMNNNINNENALLRNKNCELMKDNKIMKDSLKQIKIENDSLNKEINEQSKNISINEKTKDDLEKQNKNYEIQIQKHLQKITMQSFTVLFIYIIILRTESFIWDLTGILTFPVEI